MGEAKRCQIRERFVSYAKEPSLFILFIGNLEAV